MDQSQCDSVDLFHLILDGFGMLLEHAEATEELAGAGAGSTALQNGGNDGVVSE
jgi:hypothetical protein